MEYTFEGPCQCQANAPTEVDATEYANENRDLTGSTPPTARAPPSPSKHLLSRLTSYWRIAQTPKWLNFSRLNPRDPDHPYHPSSPRQGVKGRRTRLNAAEANYPVFRHVTHSEIFHLPSMERDGITEELGEREWKESQWRAKALPTFNSMAIESRIGWLPGLVRVLSGVAMCLIGSSPMPLWR